MKTTLTIILFLIANYSFAQPCMVVQISKQNPSCIGMSDGTATVIISGGTQPYTYMWSTGETSTSVSNLAVGNYSVTVSDAGTCTVTENFTIEHAPVIEITSNVTQTCENIPITFFATQYLGGTNPQYQWQVNGANVGINDPTYVDSTLNDGDVVTAIITSNDTCVSTPTATSNAITVSINSAQQPVITQNGNTLSTIPASHHQWFLNGDPIAGDTTQTITIDSLGDYTVMITDSNGCQATSAVFTVTAIGINEIQSILINSYPVPATDYLHFTLDEKLTKTALIILNSKGKLVKTINSDFIDNNSKINISDLDPGIYIIQLKSGDTLYVNKFVKQ